jgi:hypothetical protein
MTGHCARCGTEPSRHLGPGVKDRVPCRAVPAGTAGVKQIQACVRRRMRHLQPSGHVRRPGRLGIVQRVQQRRRTAEADGQPPAAVTSGPGKGRYAPGRQGETITVQRGARSSARRHRSPLPPSRPAITVDHRIPRPVAGQTALAWAPRDPRYGHAAKRRRTIHDKHFCRAGHRSSGNSSQQG